MIWLNNMKWLIRYILKFHRETLLNEIVSDYFGSIPVKVSDEAISVLSEKRVRVEKWIAYQSLHLQRRMVNEPKNADVLFGMLLQAKLMNHMITGVKSIPEELEGTISMNQAKEEARKIEHEKAIAGAAAFKDKKK